MIAETEVAEVVDTEVSEVEQVVEVEMEGEEIDDETTEQQDPEASVDEVKIELPPPTPEDVAQAEKISRMISADADYIRNIRSLEWSVADAEAELDDAKAVVKRKTKAFDEKVAALREAIRIGPERGLPLFSSANTDNREVSESFASVNGDSASADATASTPENVPADDDSWKSVTLDQLGLTGKLHESLTEAGLTTMGAIADWSSSGKLLTDVPGIGEAKAAKIEEATARYWAEHPRMNAEEALGDIVRDVLENPPTEEEHFKAIYNAGIKACHDGVPSMQNPHEIGSTEANAWNSGWNTEFAAKSANSEATTDEDFSDI